MNYRINDGERFSDWNTNYFDTSDLIAYNSKDSGKLKFILTVDKTGKITENGRKALELINPNAKLVSRAIDLGDKYNSLEGIEVAIGNLGKTGEYLRQDEILSNKVWRILARHPDEVSKEFAEDPNLLNEYSKLVASKTGANENMAVYVDSLEKSPKLRAWCVYRLELRSCAVGGCDLDGYDGRFLGIAPEALSAPGKGASNIKAYTMADLEAVDKVMKDLEGKLHPDVLKPFVQLRKKL